MTDNDVRIVVDAENRTATAFGAAAKGAKTVGDVAEIAGKQVRAMGEKLEDAQAKARRLAAAEEVAAAKTRELADRMVVLQRQIAANGDESGDLTKKLDRLQVAVKASAIATDDYRRAANRASSEAREQARAYDRVADNARQAARAVAMLGAAARLAPGGSGGRGGVGGVEGWLRGVLGIGESGMEGIGSAGGALGGEAGPLVPAALAGVGFMTVGPLLGGAAGGAAGLGAGAAGVGLGLAGAWMGDPDKYGKQWAGMIDRLKQRWLSSSAQFAGPLEDSLREVDRVMRDLPIERIASASRGFVGPLVGGAGSGVTEMAKGFADLLASAQPVVDNVGPKLGNLGRDVGDAMRAIGMGSEGGAHALGDLIDVAGYAIKSLGILVMGLETVYEGERRMVSGIADLGHAIPGPARDIMGLGDGLFHVESSSITFAKALHSAGDAAEDADRGVAGLSESLDQLRAKQLASADAGLALAQGWLDLQKELSEGKRTLDLSTQAGIDNTRAIEQQIKNALAVRDAEIQRGGATAEATEAANAAYAATIERIRAMALSLGFTKTQVDALVTSLAQVPPVTTATVQTPGLGSALEQGISLGNALNRIDGDYYASVHVSYTSSGKPISLAHGGVTGSLSRVNDWRNGATGYASGGATSWGGDMAGLGEVIRTPDGSTVIPAGSGRALMRDLATGGGGGRDEVPTVIIGSDGTRLGDLLVDIIALAVKQRGGRPETLGIRNK